MAFLVAVVSGLLDCASMLVLVERVARVLAHILACL
jgi:hypothetical protein